MRRDLRGRTPHPVSNYHERLHEDAVARVAEFLALRALGLSYREIGERYGKTGQSIRLAIKRQEQRTR